MEIAYQFIKNVYVFIVSFLTILNFGAVFLTLMLYRQLYLVDKGGKAVNFRFLNQINVLTSKCLFCIENIVEMFAKGC